MHEEPGAVSVLLGRGDGTFGPPAEYEAGHSPALVAAGDFNGDGLADLAVASRSVLSCDAGPCTPTFRGEVRFLLGNGDGAFASGLSFDHGSDAVHLVVADLDHDGADDLIASYRSLPLCDPSGCQSGPAPIVVLFGSPDGTLRTLEPWPSGGPVPPVASGDFDGDGVIDLVVDFFLLHGLGDGTFGPPSYMLSGFAGVGHASTQVAIDLDGDGRLDLAMARSGSNDVAILPGDGRGGLAAPQVFGAASAIGGMAFGDFNEDGRVDILLGTGAIGFAPGPVFNSGALAILFGAGGGRFLAPARYITGDGAAPMAVADFDGDGREDLAVATGPATACDFGGCHELPATVAILTGRRDGTLAPAIRTEVGGRPSAIAAADLNGDRRVDLAVARDRYYRGTEPDLEEVLGDVTILLGRGDGTFRAPLRLEAGAGPSSVAVEDFNGDLTPDLVAVSPFAACPLPPCDAASGDAAILLGNGDGTFRPAVHFDAGDFPARVAAGRLDGDRALDLVVTHAGASLETNAVSVSILRGRGDGTFPARADLPAGDVPLAIAIGDLDGDRKPDLAIGTGSSVAVLRGDGIGGFGAAAFYPAAGGIPTLSIGDFDADGVPDLAAASSGEVALLAGRGDGTLGPAAFFGAGGPAVSIAGLDLDGDGLRDIAVTTCAVASTGIIGIGGPGFGGRRSSEACIGTTGLSVLLNRLRRVCDDHCPGGAGRLPGGNGTGFPTPQGTRAFP